MQRIAVLVSGRGSNLRVILEHVAAGRIPAEIGLVLSNVPEAPALAFARGAGVPVWAESHKNYPSRAAFDAAMLQALRAARIEAVVLAGYMRLLSGDFIRAYNGKILNIHPSLLPAFPGTSGGADALGYGVKIAGCTVHFVVEAMDAGPVIIQAATTVAETDTEESFMARVHALEHRIYPQAVSWLAEGRLSISGRAVSLADGGKKPAPGPDGALVHPPLEEGF